jgi:hypothetical protein
MPMPESGGVKGAEKGPNVQSKGKKKGEWGMEDLRQLYRFKKLIILKIYG